VTHLTMEQLTALREPGLEPGVQAWRDHAAECPVCRTELDRLDQRVARLKALPTLRPGQDRFSIVSARAAAERRSARRRQAIRFTLVGLAMAASITLVVGVVRMARPERQLVRVSPDGGLASPELEQVMNRSQQLERAIAQFDQDRQVVDGRTASITETLEDRLARVDRQIEMVDVMNGSARQQEALRLWRERVGLLDALMDVHLTGARYVGF
jgi:DNA repair exonuclease SbcCD ATPase subunit